MISEVVWEGAPQAACPPAFVKVINTSKQLAWHYFCEAEKMIKALGASPQSPGADLTDATQLPHLIKVPSVAFSRRCGGDMISSNEVKKDG